MYVCVRTCGACGRISLYTYIYMSCTRDIEEAVSTTHVYTHTHVVQNYTPFGREKKFCQVCNPSGAYHQNFRPAGSETKIRIQKQGFDMVDMGARKDAPPRTYGVQSKTRFVCMCDSAATVQQNATPTTHTVGLQFAKWISCC